MNTKSKIMLAGAAGIAALAAATPASAQYYNNNPANIIGSIINGVLGYGQYPYGNYGYGQSNYQSSQVAVNQCARAVEARLNNSYAYGYGNGYNNQGYGNPYNNPYYGNPYNQNYGNSYSGWAIPGQGRVLGVSNVEMRSMGRLRVTGVATSGNRYRNPYGYGNYAYNRQYGTPDLRFTCKAEANGRVYDVNIQRASFYGRWQ